MEQVLSILRDRGVIDGQTEERLLAQHVVDQRRAAEEVAGILGGVEWHGDLRLRYEGFRYGEDAFGLERDDRNRFRYRARFGFTTNVNDVITGGVRLASGGGDLDSTHRTLGASEDFEPDPIFFDRAWLDLALIEGRRASLHVMGGRVPNPYTWGKGEDRLIWDSDINLTGGYLRGRYEPRERTELFVTAGSFIAREHATSADPKIVAGQLGLTSAVGKVGIGLRGSWYEYRSLDGDAAPGEMSGFIAATTADGNLVGASLDDAGAFDDGRARVVDMTGYVELGASEAWPLLVYGTFARNLAAESLLFDDGVNPPIAIDEEDDAWGIGFEIGDAKDAVKLGAGYFHVEANSVIARFTDGALFDGKTNREGWMVYGRRRIAPNTDLTLTLFRGEAIEQDGAGYLLLDEGGDLVRSGPFASSLGDADRIRFQADVQVAF